MCSPALPNESGSMPRHSPIALVRATPATVQDDYRGLLRLVAPSLAPPFGPLLVLPAPPGTLPGARAEPWQLDGMLAALAQHGSLPNLHIPGVAADPLVAVARSYSARLIPFVPPQFVLCGFAQVPQLAKYAAARATPSLFVVDAVTTIGCSVSAPRLDIRGALFASTNPAALAALAERLVGAASGSAEFDLCGDPSIAGETWDAEVGARRPPLRVTLAERFAQVAGLSQPRAQLLYEEWVFNTSWGKLFRSYQRRAIQTDQLG
jgi:hypothetical protein